jgi:hypothetical protein
MFGADFEIYLQSHGHADGIAGKDRDEAMRIL